MSAVYQPNTGPGSAVDVLLRSAGMRRLMQTTADQAGGIARRYVRFPDRLSTAVEMRGARWRAVVVNGSRGALWEEYGSRGKPGSHPLGKVLDAVAAADPNRRQGRRLSRG